MNRKVRTKVGFGVLRSTYVYLKSPIHTFTVEKEGQRNRIRTCMTVISSRNSLVCIPYPSPSKTFTHTLTTPSLKVSQSLDLVQGILPFPLYRKTGVLLIPFSWSGRFNTSGPFLVQNSLHFRPQKKYLSLCLNTSINHSLHLSNRHWSQY